MRTLLTMLILLLLAAPLSAQQMYGVGLTRGVTVDVPCYGPLPAPTPNFQEAYSGTFESLSGSGDRIVYSQEGSIARVTVLLGTNSWAEGEIDVTGKRKLIFPLFAPKGLVPIGEMKMCSPSFSLDRPTLCTNILARAQINNRLVFPLSTPQAIAQGLEIFGDQRKCSL